MYDKNLIQGKRIAAIDYGTKRIGIAVCDELHISINPLSTIEATKPDYFDKIMNILTNERISLVIGRLSPSGFTIGKRNSKSHNKLCYPS